MATFNTNRIKNAVDGSSYAVTSPGTDSLGYLVGLNNQQPISLFPSAEGLSPIRPTPLPITSVPLSSGLEVVTIQNTARLSSASGDGTTVTYTYTIAGANTYAIGDIVNVSNFTGQFGYNIRGVVTGATPNTFTLAGTPTGASAGIGLAVSLQQPLTTSLLSALGDGLVITYTYATAGANTYRAGQVVNITGFGQAGYNITGVVTGATANNFTLAGSQTLASTGTGFATQQSTGIRVSRSGLYQIKLSASILTTFSAGFVAANTFHIIVNGAERSNSKRYSVNISSSGVAYTYSPTWAVSLNLGDVLEIGASFPANQNITSSILSLRSNVRQWSDKSGLENNAIQSTVSRQPTVNSSGVNGLPTLSFNGTSQFLLLPDSTRLDFTTNDFSIFALVRANPANNTSIHNIISKNSAATPQWKLAVELNTANVTIFNSSAQQSTAAAAVSSGLMLLNGVVNRSSGNTLFQNGAVIATTTSTIAGSISNNVTVTIGSDLNGTSRFWNSDMAEIIVYTGIPTTTQRQNVEGYLAWKWGTQGSLPANHPFANSPPVAFVPTSISGCGLWLDAAQTPVGRQVRQWTDKSSITNNVTQTLIQSQPIYTQNNQSIYFDGNITNLPRLNITNVTPYLNTNLTVFVVERREQATGAFISGTAAATGQQLQFFYNTPTNLTFGIFDVNADITVPAFTSPNQEPYRIWAFTFTSSQRQGFLNGTLGVTRTGALSLLTAWTGAAIGTLTATGNPAYRGSIREVLFYNSELNTSNRQNVEGYLAWKWGLVSSLPANHPFRNAGPVGFVPTSIPGNQLWLDGADANAVVLESDLPVPTNVLLDSNIQTPSNIMIQQLSRF